MEHAFHQWLAQQLANTQARFPSLVLGVGDDAAVVDIAINDGPVSSLADGMANGLEMIVATDTIAEGTHFELPAAEMGDSEYLSQLQLVGRKLVAVNLSDLAAMGAAPEWLTLNFQLPQSFQLPQAQAIFQGVQSICEEYEVAIIGGDTNRWSGELVLSATLLGSRPRGLSGWRLQDARPGDLVLCSGVFGGSIQGRHLRFEPRIELSQYLVRNYDIHAATDASDSLTVDLMAIARASNVQIELDMKAIPIAGVCSNLGPEAGLQHALYDGEDFELLLTMSPEVANKVVDDRSLPGPLVVLGQVRPGAPGLVEADGTPIPIRGYVH